jgi:hypothetical protein
VHTAPSANYVYSCHLRSVPGQAGHLFFTPGDGSLSFTGQPSRSTNGGVTWTTGLTTNGGQAITNVSDFGFGKAATGKTYPAIYFWGQVNGGAYGLYRSDDNLVTSVYSAITPLGLSTSLWSLPAILMFTDAYGCV